MKTISKIYKCIKSDANTKNVVSNVIYSFLIKGGSIIISLLTTPAYIRYFNNNTVLGLWFTLLSVLTWMYNFDFGLGNGVRNKIVKTIYEGNEEETRKYISSAYIFLTIVSVVAYLIMSFSIRYLDLNNLLGVADAELSGLLLLKASRILLCSVMVQLVLRLISSISYALQYAYIPSLLSLITSTVLLLFVSIVNRSSFKGDIVLLSYAYFCTVNIPLLAVTIVLFSTKLQNVVPSIKFFSWFHAKDSLRLGIVFLYLQLASMFMSNSASFLISNIFGAEHVVEYQLYYKIFNLVCTMMALVLSPMWSAITKALSEGKSFWMKRLFSIMFGFAILSFIFEIFLIPFLQIIFNIWLGDRTISVNNFTAFLFALYGGIFVWQYVCSCISNGLGKLRVQVIGMSLGIPLGIIFAIFFAQIWNNYLGILAGMIVGYMPFCIAQTVWTLKFCKGENNNGK